jgi:hypothetical protein
LHGLYGLNDRMKTWTGDGCHLKSERVFTAFFVTDPDSFVNPG